MAAWHHDWPIMLVEEKVNTSVVEQRTVILAPSSISSQGSSSRLCYTYAKDLD
jgi:hypothetical protein